VGEGPAANLVMELFPKEGDLVVDKLREFPDMQFKYLQQVMKALRAFHEEGAPPTSAATQRMVELLRREHMKVSADMHLQYVELLCRFHPDDVYGHLSQPENQYPLAQTLDATLELVTRYVCVQCCGCVVLFRPGVFALLCCCFVPARRTSLTVVAFPRGISSVLFLALSLSLSLSLSRRNAAWCCAQLGVIHVDAAGTKW